MCFSWSPISGSWIREHGSIVMMIGRGDRHDGSSVPIKDELACLVLTLMVEVEHIVERTRNGIERTARLNTLAEQPVVLDEPQDRRLVGEGVIDVVALG